MRLLAIAHAVDGCSRAEAAHFAGMERQALRDAVSRCNAEGLHGLPDRPRSGRPEGLSPGHQAALKATPPAPAGGSFREPDRSSPDDRRVLRGPDPEKDGVSVWRLADIWPMPGELAACAAAHGACRARSSGSGCRGRKPGLSTLKAARPNGTRWQPGLGSKLAAIADARPGPGWPTTASAAFIPSLHAGRAPVTPSPWTCRRRRPAP